MTWVTIIALSLAAAALAAYALWPWATNKHPRMVYVSLLAVLTGGILIGPGLTYFLWNKPDSMTDLSAFKLGGKGDGFTWDGPLGSGSSKGNPHSQDMSLENMTARLAKRLEAQPDDLNGWVLLGRSYAAMGNIDKAKEIFNTVGAKWPTNAEVKVAYGEMLMTAADGAITPEARQSFEAAVALDPRHIRAQYDLALADAQAGNHQAAYDRWLSLTKDAAPDAPWLPEVAARLEEMAEKLGIEAPQLAMSTGGRMPQPSSAQVAAAMDMNPADREAFIRSMVEGLAAKLKENPNDLQGWLRLGRSYAVLKEWDKARTAYDTGLHYFPDNPDLKNALAALPRS